MTPSQRLTAIHRRASKRITIEPMEPEYQTNRDLQFTVQLLIVFAAVLVGFAWLSGAFIADQIIMEIKNV